MTSINSLQDLKNQISSLDKMDLQEMQKFTSQFRDVIEEHYRQVKTTSIIFKSYIDYIIISHIQTLDSFIRMLHDIKNVELNFIRKAVKYHFTCIIDSFTYACIALPHEHLDVND